MNIDGLSEATLEKFIQNGLIKDFTVYIILTDIRT